MGICLKDMNGLARQAKQTSGAKENFCAAWPGIGF
jgi:hypothetical protein